MAASSGEGLTQVASHVRQRAGLGRALARARIPARAGLANMFQK